MVPTRHSTVCCVLGLPNLQTEFKQLMFKSGLMIKKGYCSCDLPILEFAGELFIEGLIEAGKILEKVICPALKAIDVVVAIGMAAIPPPGRAITGGMGKHPRSFLLCIGY